ncbi:MAG: hypothetical protein IJL55_08095 [Lachnospiraceae bacterium]|nr:hypothetical protein [Lachnospiraceae bacterium]
MTNDEIRNSIVLVLEEMKKKAETMGIQGVAVASVLNKGEDVDWIGEMKVVGTPCNFKEGWNLVAIAWSKCGEAIATEETAVILSIKRSLENAVLSVVHLKSITDIRWHLRSAVLYPKRILKWQSSGSNL